MEGMVGTMDQRGDLCGCLFKWFRVSWGYGLRGLRDDLGQLRTIWGSCERAIQPPQPRCLPRTHPTTAMLLMLHRVSIAHPRQAHLTHSHSPPDFPIFPTTLTACSKSPIARYNPHLGGFIHSCKPAPEPPPDQTCHNTTA